MAAQLFHVSLRTFREDYVKGKNQKKVLSFFSDFCQAQVQVKVGWRLGAGQEGQIWTWAIPYFWFSPPTTHHHQQ